MAFVLYYFPKGKTVSGPQINEEQLKAFGLADVFREAKPVARETFCGPDDNAGLVVALTPIHQSAIDKDGVLNVGYFPERQKWYKRNKGAWWIGVFSDSIPTPADLRRPVQLGGHELKLIDGHTWTVPVVRTADGTDSSFPKAIGLDENGEMVVKTLPKYAPFCERVMEFWNGIADQITSAPDNGNGKATFRFSQEAAYRLAVESLGFNYHIDEHVASLLSLECGGLLTTENTIQIVMAAMDVPGYNEMLRAVEDAKKNGGRVSTQDGSNSLDGIEDTIPDTGQPLPILECLANTPAGD